MMMHVNICGIKEGPEDRKDAVIEVRSGGTRLGAYAKLCLVSTEGVGNKSSEPVVLK